MKILAIDTSSKICTVAITEDTKKIIELQSRDEKTHSVKLMPMIDEALKNANLTLSDISLLTCSVGPGSFTGVRIGIATAKAFADVKNIPVVSVSSLEGLAYNLINTTTELETTLFCSMIDAKNSNVYCGLYCYSNSSLSQISDLMAEPIDTVIGKITDTLSNSDTKFNHICFVGDGAIAHKGLLQKTLANINATLTFAEEGQNDSSGMSIATCGYIKYTHGDYGTSAILSPLYLRKSQAERELEGKANKCN